MGRLPVGDRYLPRPRVLAVAPEAPAERTVGSARRSVATSTHAAADLPGARTRTRTRVGTVVSVTPSTEPAPPASPTSKGEQTRRRIVEAAMKLFEERGYASTTMRAVADEAGVSLGNAYYYFSSKDHLIQGFYDRLQQLHAEAVTPRLEGVTGFADRWAACELAFVDVAEPYQPFAGKFFSVAADPSSPLNPFSADSGPARGASTAILRDVLAGSDLSADARLRRELPGLLWLAHMGVVLFWVYDGTPSQRRTRDLVTRAAPLLERTLRLTRWRPLRSTVHELLDLVADLTGPSIAKPLNTATMPNRASSATTERRHPTRRTTPRAGSASRSSRRSLSGQEGGAPPRV